MTDNRMLASLFPFPVGPHPVEPIPFEVIWIQVEDVGHEADAYYLLGWRCASRHGRYALLCRERQDGPLLDFIIMVGPLPTVPFQSVESHA